MGAQIKDIIIQCSICNEFRETTQKEPMLPHEIPTKQWEICAIDLFELDKDTYIVIADYFSKFFKVKKISSSSSKTVINILKENFSRYGITVILKSDNGPAYSSSEFRVHSSIAIILMGKRELIALLNLSSWCLVMVERLFLAVPRGCLQFVIVVFPDHTHLLFLLTVTILNILLHLQDILKVWDI